MREALVGGPGRIIGRGSFSKIFGGPAVQEKFAPPAVGVYLDGGNVNRQWTEIVNRLGKLQEPEASSAVSGLPSTSTRPLLAAALLTELAGPQNTQVQAERQPITDLIKNSRIATIHVLPYRALHLPDVLEEMGGLDNIDIDKIYDHFCNTAPGVFEPINSTLRNALLARELNRTILKNSGFKARLAINEYTWKDRLSTVHHQDVPELPWGYESTKLAKFVITLVDEKAQRDPTYLDYGEPEGDMQRATGERLNFTPLWGVQLIDPENHDQLREGLALIAERQAGREGAIGRVGTELINKSRFLVDTAEMIGLYDPLPPILSNVEDLSESQIDNVTMVSQMIMHMWRIYSDTDVLQYQRVLPWKDWMTALVQMKQASTRTVLAALTAPSRALGMTTIELDQSASSLAKGESPASEAITFRAQNIGAVLARDGDFERIAEVLAQYSTDGDPVRISLGGDKYHPSQTLAELQTLMEQYDAVCISELRDKTADSPPTIMFMGHTQDKRADKSLIEFIAKHLPKWQIKVVVPDAKHLPTDLELRENAKYEEAVHTNLTDQREIAKLTRGVNIVYISNSYKTTEGGGKGDPVDFRLSAEVVRENGFKVMAPLPASEELDPEILNNRQYNGLIQRTIENKNSILAASLLLMIASQEVRKRSIKQN